MASIVSELGIKKYSLKVLRVFSKIRAGKFDSAKAANVPHHVPLIASFQLIGHHLMGYPGSGGGGGGTAPPDYCTLRRHHQQQQQQQQRSVQFADPPSLERSISQARKTWPIPSCLCLKWAFVNCIFSMMSLKRQHSKKGNFDYSNAGLLERDFGSS